MSKLSFSFAKKLEKPAIKPTQPQFESKDRDENEEKVVLITSICNNQIETDEKPVEQKELVIQLKPNQNKLKYKRIKKENQTEEDLNGEEDANEQIENRIKTENNIESKSEPNSNETSKESRERPAIKEERLAEQETIKSEPESLNEQARRELLDEASGKRPVKEENDLTIKLGKADAKRLDEPADEQDVEEADYSQVSVDTFGMAMLRGMARNADDLKQSTTYEPKARLGGVGLGFESRLKLENAKNATKKRYLPGQDDEDDPVKKDPNELVDDDPKIGSLVCLAYGPHKGHYGRIVSISDDLSQCQVQLALSKETVSLAICLVRLVSKKEFNKESKVLNRSKYDLFKSKSEEASKQKEESSEERSERNQSERHRDERHQNERHREDRRYDEKRQDERRREERHRNEKRRDERSRTEREDDRRRRERSSREEYSSRDRSDEHRKRERSDRDEHGRRRAR